MMRYTKELLKYTNTIFDKTREILYPQLQTIVAESKLARPTTDSIKNDDFSDKISEFIEQTRLAIEDEYPDQVLSNIALGVGVEISDFNRKEITKMLSAIAGVDVLMYEPWLQQELAAFTRRNVGLIKSISDRYFPEVENIIYSGIRNGLRHEEIKKDINKRFPVTRNRARLIARDQTNKLNGQLSQLRQQSVGVKKYRWVTVGDERVRHLHSNRDGKVFSWNKPPSDGHPGEPIQCRCYAEPILTGLFGVE
jgi:SPP1 gp7 family putative phage head morphogenesis protein